MKIPIPCQCGNSNPRLDPSYRKGWTRPDGYEILCPNCGREVYKKTKESAILAWNELNYRPNPLEAPARKLITTMLTIKCADPSEANRLRQACDEMEDVL